jgi:lysozyme
MQHGSRPRPVRLLRVLPALVVALAGLAVIGPIASGAHAATRVWGVDVADYQHPDGAAISWRSVRATGASFAIIKATEGSSYVNPFFASDWAGARTAGLVRGAYGFGRPALPYSTAAAQAEEFVRTVGSTDETGDLPPILDLEVTGGLTPAQLAVWTRTWLATAASLTGRTPILYAGQYFWADQVGNAAGFTAYPWWVPAYSSSAPRAPFVGGWKAWTMWQYTSGETVRGISGRVDASDFAGTAAQLASLADGRNTLIAAKYAALGGARGVLGAASGHIVSLAGGGFGQVYAHGAIVEQAGVAHAVWGVTGERYLSAGAWNGALGVPTSDTRGVTGGTLSTFSRGWVTAKAGKPAYELTGALLSGFVASGQFADNGWATADATPTGHSTALGNDAPVTSGLVQTFEKGDLFTSTKSGTHAVRGPILTAYLALQGPNGALGMPASDQFAGNLGPQVDFQVGALAYVAALGHAILV